MHHRHSKAVSPPRRSGKSMAVGPLSGDRKRRASSSVSSVSSVSSIEDLSDLENSEEDDADDEEDPPRVFTAPSHNAKSKTKTHKAAASKPAKKTTTNHNKKRKRNNVKVSHDDSYDEDDNDSEDSSDDVYAAVDYISDGDDEDQDMEKLEEAMILESEGEHRTGSLLGAAGAGAGHHWAGPTNVFDDDMLLAGASFFDDEQLYSAMETFGETDLASEAVETPIQMPRHVHFEPQSDSSSDSDSHTEDEIPGDFLQQDSLDPQLRRMIENDNENTRHEKRRRASDDMFGESDYGHSNIYHVESDAVSEKSESSGYETDDGETTDEDLPPPATITHPRSILRRDSSASLVQPADEKNESTTRRRGPVMGSFVPDPHKPVALVDGTGKHLVIIPAYASSRHDWLESTGNSVSGTANNSPRATTMQIIDESDTDALASPNQDFSPMLASGANLMMTALGNDINPGGQVMGPPEAFYPSRDLTIDSSFEDDDDEDPEAGLNVEDFIDFGNGSSDDELDDDDDDKPFDDDTFTSPAGAAAPSALQMSDVPESPTPRAAESQQASSAERFLNHLDRGIVTAFRRNHNRYQALLRLPQHREFMPANSPARPASVFRHARLADQRTPTRKRRNGSTGEAVRRKLMDAHRRNQLPF